MHEVGPRKQVPDPILVAAVIQAAEYRRYITDQMMWQVPVLSLTAQSFLLIIAFGSGPHSSRVTAAGLACLAALATIQLLLKHRYMEETYSRALERIECDNNLPLVHGKREDVQSWVWPGGGHEWDAPDRPWKLLKEVRKHFVARKSYLVWTAALAIFATVDLVTAVAIAL